MLAVSTCFVHIKLQTVPHCTMCFDFPDTFNIRPGEEELPEEEDWAVCGPVSAAGVPPPGGGPDSPRPVRDQVRAGETRGGG